MIQREDILSVEYLKKTEFTGCHRGMRYRLEGITDGDGETKLRCTVWPEPFSFFKTPDEKKESEEFPFGEDGVVEAIAWMNERLVEEEDKWKYAGQNWD